MLVGYCLTCGAVKGDWRSKRCGRCHALYAGQQAPTPSRVARAMMGLSTRKLSLQLGVSRGLVQRALRNPNHSLRPVLAEILGGAI